MNGRDKRKKRAQRKRDTPPVPRAKSPFGGLCPNGCGEPGPHFVPPSFGDPGFFICTPLAEGTR